MRGMNQSAEVLFKLIHVALGIEKNISLPNVVNWQEVFLLANRQGVDALVWTDMLSEHSDELGISEGIKYKWIGHQAIVEKDNGRRFQALRSLGSLWQTEGISPLILKGLSYAVLYPIPFHRKSCDLDSYLFDRWEDGNVIVERNGIKVSRNFYKDSSFTYHGLRVENHKYCTPIRGGKKRKKYELFLRGLLEGSNLEKLPGTFFYTPPPLFNLLFFLSHAQNHFLNEGGIQLRHVCDWGVLMQKYTSEKVGQNDLWDDVLRYSRQYGFHSFLFSISQVARKVCGVQIPFECPINEKADTALLNEILCPTCEQVEFSKGWKTRKMLVKSMIQSRWKYKLFSEESMYKVLLKSVSSFLFEKNPVLKET